MNLVKIMEKLSKGEVVVIDKHGSKGFSILEIFVEGDKIIKNKWTNLDPKNPYEQSQITDIEALTYITWLTDK